MRWDGELVHSVAIKAKWSAPVFGGASFLFFVFDQEEQKNNNNKWTLVRLRSHPLHSSPLLNSAGLKSCSYTKVFPTLQYIKTVTQG